MTTIAVPWILAVAVPAAAFMTGYHKSLKAGALVAFAILLGFIAIRAIEGGAL